MPDPRFLGSDTPRLSEASPEASLISACAGDVERSLELDALRDEAAGLIASSQAANTRRAYRADWHSFVEWCQRFALVPLPATAETVCLYLAAESSRRAVSTLRRRMSSISQAHQAAGHLPPPTHSLAVRKLWAGILRERGRQEEGAAPLVAQLLIQVIGALPDGLMGCRDRALILLGYAGAFRRSELVALEIRHVRQVPRGLLVHVERSKTDQEGHGDTKPIARGSAADRCPVTAVLAWLEALREREILTGRLLRSIDRHGNVGTSLSDRAVALILKRAAEAAGMDPGPFSGHSLRAGFLTTAAELGASELELMRVSGHRSAETLRRYIRPATAFDASAAGKSGL